MYDEFKQNTVKVTLHLTEDAAKVLYQYAGERGRGWFVSQLLLEQRKRDEQVAQSIAHRSGADADGSIVP